MITVHLQKNYNLILHTVLLFYKGYFSTSHSALNKCSSETLWTIFNVEKINEKDTLFINLLRSWNAWLISWLVSLFFFSSFFWMPPIPVLNSLAGCGNNQTLILCHLQLLLTNNTLINHMNITMLKWRIFLNKVHNLWGHVKISYHDYTKNTASQK
jgi:hypothetical protein